MKLHIFLRRHKNHIAQEGILHVLLRTIYKTRFASDCHSGVKCDITSYACLLDSIQQRKNHMQLNYHLM